MEEEMVKCEECGKEFKTSQGLAGHRQLAHRASLSEESTALVKLGPKEIVPPEEALRHIRLQDGDYKSGFIDGMGTLIMAARYNQLLAASQAEVLSSQLRIMEEARKGSAEAAQEAAARAAAQVGAEVLPKLDALQAQVGAQSPNPMSGLMMTLMQPVFQQTAQQLAQLFGSLYMPQSAPGGQVSQGQPPNIEERPLTEWRG